MASLKWKKGLGRLWVRVLDWWLDCLVCCFNGANLKTWTHAVQHYLRGIIICGFDWLNDGSNAFSCNKRERRDAHRVISPCGSHQLPQRTGSGEAVASLGKPPWMRIHPKGYTQESPQSLPSLIMFLYGAISSKCSIFEILGFGFFKAIDLRRVFNLWFWKCFPYCCSEEKVSGLLMYDSSLLYRCIIASYTGHLYSH